MENSHESHNNGYVLDPGLQIGRHISYKSSAKLLLHWFDIRVFYARISNFSIDNSAPECLTINHTPLNPHTVLEVNGIRCLSDSEVSCVLRRDRMDKKSEELTFVSTDSIRTTGSVRFEIFDKEELLISGNLDLSNPNGLIGESNQSWRINCESSKEKQMVGSKLALPSIEVYVAGCFGGTPIVLTKTLQLVNPDKETKVVLDSDREYESSESHEDIHRDMQVTEYKPDNEEEYNNVYWDRTEYIEDEDGELSWFNAGVRVGVGIGLGICLGVGIGVGLLVRTCQTTTRTFGRRLG